MVGSMIRGPLHTKQNIKALGLVVLIDFFNVFSHDAPGAWPVWTLEARLAGFIKRTSMYCIPQYMKALGLEVSEKILFLVFQLKAM